MFIYTILAANKISQSLTKQPRKQLCLWQVNLVKKRVLWHFTSKPLAEGYLDNRYFTAHEKVSALE